MGSSGYVRPLKVSLGGERGAGDGRLARVLAHPAEKRR